MAGPYPTVRAIEIAIRSGRFLVDLRRTAIDRQIRSLRHFAVNDLAGFIKTHHHEVATCIGWQIGPQPAIAILIGPGPAW